MSKEGIMLRKLVLATFVAGMLVHGGTALAQKNYKSEYRLSTVVNNTMPWGWAGERWGELIKEKTQGRINVKQYPGVSLVGGEQTREFTAIRQGIIDMAVGSTINWSPQIKELNLFALPFLMPDEKALDALIEGEVGKELFKIIEKQVVPLAWGENGFREVSNSKRAIATPDDIKGLKLRVVGSPLFNDIFNALGANPTSMSWADAQTALASNAVDGQENPLAIFFASKLPQVGQKYLTLWGYMGDPLIFVVNKEVWASWTPADQQIVRETALQAAKEGINKVRTTNADYLKQIEAAGVTITTLTPEQHARFVQATRPVFEKWTNNIGADLVKKAEAAVANR
jgi:tripartite ATP-independent transporter DctP family solute receptor